MRHLFNGWTNSRVFVNRPSLFIHRSVSRRLIYLGKIKDIDKQRSNYYPKERHLREKIEQKNKVEKNDKGKNGL